MVEHWRLTPLGRDNASPIRVGARRFWAAKYFSALQTALPFRYWNDNFLLKWTLLLLSKRITIRIPTLANMNTTSLGSGENIFFPQIIR